MAEVRVVFLLSKKVSPLVGDCSLLFFIIA